MVELGLCLFEQILERNTAHGQLGRELERTVVIELDNGTHDSTVLITAPRS